MSGTQMKFKIHTDLKDFEKALKVISEEESNELFDEAIEITKKHRLFKLAFELFENSPNKIVKIR